MALTDSPQRHKGTENIKPQVNTDETPHLGKPLNTQKRQEIKIQ